MRVLYVSGSPTDGMPPPMEEFARLTPAFEVQCVAGAAAALVEIRTSGGYGALFIAHDLPHNEALALIASLRRDRVPIAIAAVVTESQEDFFAPAITAGADDVVLMRAGSLVSPEDTLKRLRQSRYLEPEDTQRPLQVLYAGDDDLAWDLLEQMPFLRVHRVACEEDGVCPLVTPDADAIAADVLIVDEHPGHSHPLQAVKAAKAQNSSVTVVVLTSPTGADIGGAAQDLGADDVVSKAGVYRRRFVAALHRIYVKRTSAAAPDRTVPFHPVFGTGAPEADEQIDRLQAELSESARRLEEFEERLRELGGIEEKYQDVLGTLDTLRAEQATRADELKQERQQRAEERAEFDATLQARADDRTGDEADRQALAERARVAEDTLAAERERWDAARHSSDERFEEFANLEQEYQALVNTVGPLRTENAALTEALGFERAMRDRDRTELESAKRALTEERERRSVLEATLRQTEERADADLTALKSEQAAVRRSLEDRLAVASERLHTIANDTQALQVQLQNEIAARANAQDRLIQCDVFGHALMRGDGSLVRCNDAFARMFGYADAQEAVEMSGQAPFAGTAGRQDLDAQLSADGHLSGVTSVVQHADGHQFYVLESAVVLPGQDGEAALIERVLVEAADRARLEGELRFARRLEAAGRLAAEMAPEIDPLLASVVQPSGTTEVDRTRVVALVRQLLAFARRQSQPAGFLSLNDAIRRAEPLLRRIAGDFTDFQIRFADNLEAVAAGEPDIDELLTTIIFSATLLLPMGGAIVLETQRQEATADEGPSTTLTVTASGYGLRTATLPEALELAASRCGGVASLTTDDHRAAMFRVTLR